MLYKYQFSLEDCCVEENIQVFLFVCLFVSVFIFRYSFPQSVILTGLEPTNIKHTDLKLSMILPPLPLNVWDCKHVTPAQTNVFTYLLFIYFDFFQNPTRSHAVHIEFPM